MSRTRICYNCLNYEQHSSVTTGVMHTQAFAPRCVKGLNPSLAHAPVHNHLREEGAFEPDQMAMFCDHYLWSPFRYAKFRKASHMGLRKFGDKFRNHQMYEKFIPYFEKGHLSRIKIERGVNMRYTECGFVGMSTGWEPCFLLMRSIKARASSVVLAEDDEIIAHRPWDQKHYTRIKA